MSNTPRLALAPGGPHRWRLYVTYAASASEIRCGAASLGPKLYSPVSSQVYLIWSDDRGESWSSPLPLGPPIPETGVKRFFPAVAVGADGTVDVVYFESQERQRATDSHVPACSAAINSGFFRQAPARSLVDLWAVRSTDGGATFGAPLRVTRETSDWCDAQFDFAGPLFSNFGDYLGIFSGANRTFVVWTDGRHNVPDAYFTTLQSPAP